MFVFPEAQHSWTVQLDEAGYRNILLPDKNINTAVICYVFIKHEQTQIFEETKTSTLRRHGIKDLCCRVHVWSLKEPKTQFYTISTT